MSLDHERLDVYCVSVDFAVWAYRICRRLEGADRHARDQFLRASQSIALNIAEGCGKAPHADRARFLQIASGSARECAATLDILNGCDVISSEQRQEGKDRLVRIVAMLTRMIVSCRGVMEEGVGYEYEYVNGDGEQRTIDLQSDKDPPSEWRGR